MIDNTIDDDLADLADPVFARQFIFQCYGLFSSAESIFRLVQTVNRAASTKAVEGDSFGACRDLQGVEYCLDHAIEQFHA